MRESWKTKAENVAEPKVPPLPQIKSPGDVPSERSAETHVGPVIAEDVSITRSRYWKRRHSFPLICGEVCGEITEVTAGLTCGEVDEIESKIGAKLDVIGLPGLVVGISGKQGTSRSKSEERSTTHTCPTKAPDCDGLNHAEYQLVDRYTFEYCGGFWGNKRQMHYVERELDVFDRARLLTKQECRNCDQDLAKPRREGYLVPIVARDGALAAIFPAKPDGEGSYQVSGSNDRFRLGDVVPSDLVIRFFHLRGELRDAWSAASARWEAYEGSIAALHAGQTRKAGISTSGSNKFALGLFCAGALAIIGLVLKGSAPVSRTERNSSEDFTSKKSGKDRRNLWKGRRANIPSADTSPKYDVLRELSSKQQEGTMSES
jgi:hypothetical protein